jgi:hypothetical protein
MRGFVILELNLPVIFSRIVFGTNLKILFQNKAILPLANFVSKISKYVHPNVLISITLLKKF